jgi:hypothetical protein
MTPPSPPATGPSPTDHSRFRQDGYLVMPNALPAGMVADLQTAADRLLIHTTDTVVREQRADDRLTWWRLPTGQTYVLKIKSVVEQAPQVGALAAGPVMQGLATELLAGQVEVIDSKFMYKATIGISADWADLPELGEEVCKHTDAAYYRTRGYNRVLTVAVCLDDCTEAAGSLQVWPGTHRADIKMISTERQGPVVPDCAAPDRNAVSLYASAGSILAWDSALVHASGPNVSGRPRRLLVLGFALTPGQG